MDQSALTLVMDVMHIEQSAMRPIRSFIGQCQYNVPHIPAKCFVRLKSGTRCERYVSLGHRFSIYIAKSSRE